jgi:hypothetical protein
MNTGTTGNKETTLLYNSSNDIIKPRKFMKKNCNYNQQGINQKKHNSPKNLPVILHSLLMNPVALLLVRRVVDAGHATSCKSGVVFGSTGHLAGQLLESLALGLGDQESGEDTAQHEQGVDLHDVVEPGAFVCGSRAADAEGSDEDLGDDGADFAGGGGDSMGG